MLGTQISLIFQKVSKKSLAYHQVNLDADKISAKRANNIYNNKLVVTQTSVAPPTMNNERDSFN